jgi:hypothetical protein
MMAPMVPGQGGAAQATNDLDEGLSSHGVFERDPAVSGGESAEGS